jgi:hypothetical protein
MTQLVVCVGEGRAGRGPIVRRGEG